MTTCSVIMFGQVDVLPNIASTRHLPSVAKANYRDQRIQLESGHASADLPIAPALAAAELDITTKAKRPKHDAAPTLQTRSPGRAMVHTHTQPDLIRDVLRQAQPAQRLVTAGQINALAALLCSNAADRYSLARQRRPDRSRPTDRI